MSRRDSGGNYREFTTDELTYFERRERRQNVVDELKDHIEQEGYNPARPLQVVKENGNWLVADGNHRLQALRELNWDKPVPAFVDPDGDPVKTGVTANEDDGVFAPEDLFDTLDTIELLSEDWDLTQSEIAKELAISRSKVADHASVLNNIVADVLILARKIQTGRETNDVANATFDFSEGWFRTSNLYDLNRDGVDSYKLPNEKEPKHAQMRVMKWFCEDKNCNASKNQVQNKVEEIEGICEQLDQLEEQLKPGVSDKKRQELYDSIVQGEYTDSTLESAIQNANRDAKDRVLFGTDAIEGLETVEENSVDCVVMDPPYGVDYTSHRNTDRPEFEDGYADTMKLLDDVFNELTRVCKANAHLYIFFPMKLDASMGKLASKYFDVTEVPLIWVKNNHVPTRDAEHGFDRMYAHQYEPIMHARMPKGDQRELNGGVSPNVLQHGRPSGDERWHDAQKPRDLLTELITNSTGKNETVLDPFAGSGSALLAAKAQGRHYIGIEKNDEYESRFTKELRELK